MRFKQKFITSTAMALTLISGYGRRAYSSCVSAGAPNYLCSGTNTSGQYLTSINNATVTTAPGFSVNVNSTHAISITGDGALSFIDTNNSTLTSTDRVGLRIRSIADNGGIPGSIFVNTNGNISGGYTGIHTENNGTGSLSIFTHGNVTGLNQDGIYATNFGTNLTIETGTGTTVSGVNQGIVAFNNTGSLSITAGGDVIASSGGGYAIVANNTGTNLNITTAGGADIYGGWMGIRAMNNFGTLTINTGGNVTGIDSAGIYAVNNGNGSHLTIETRAGTAVTGGEYGIYARNFGSGILSITANGNVAGGTNRQGILAINHGTDLTIETANGSEIVGGSTGIDARNLGTGALSVTAADVTGDNGAGIRAYNYNGTDLSIQTLAGTTVTGVNQGILTRNYGSGSLSISADGDITATGPVGSAGILAVNYGTDLTIETGADSTVSGAFGINAFNSGSGAFNITTNGDVVGISQYGIYAYNSGTDLSMNINGNVTAMGNYAINAINTGANLSIVTGADSILTGQRGGILAQNQGTGHLSITVDGDISGGSSYGIYARNYGTDLLIETGSGSIISNTYTGINARNYGSGSLTIHTEGNVIATNQFAISARNNGTDLNIETGNGSTVLGGQYGILALNQGTGALSITANGNVSGSSHAGIFARNYGYSTDIIIETGAGSTITGQTHGIRAMNNGIGSISITAGGDVTSARNGIEAVNYASGVDLRIETSAASHISSNGYGILARNQGSGLLSIIANGTVSDGSQYGIYAHNFGTDLTIETSSTVYAANTAITAANNGTGALSVTTNGDVIGNAINGILARNHGTNLTIETAAGTITSAANHAIMAFNEGTGALSITAGGDVTGATNYGIYARNYGTDLTVETASGSTVSGGTHGIMARNYGSGALTVIAGGNVTGGNDYYGIRAINHSATDLTIHTSASTTIAGGYGGISASNYGTGSLSISIAGDVTAATGTGITARGYGTDMSIETAAGTLVSGYLYGIIARHNGTGALSITAAGDINGLNYGMIARSYGTGVAVEIQSGATVSSNSNGTGMAVSSYGSGNLSINNHGTITGGTGLFITNMGGASIGILTDGIIEGTLGTAIQFRPSNYSPYYGTTYFQTTATPIEIAGGRIIGDIVDGDSHLGFSPVTVTGDFISEGSFFVSDFNVASGGDFTLSAGNLINSYNTVDVDGTFTADGGNVSNSLSVNTGGVLNANEGFTIGGSFTNNGTTSIATGKNLVIDTMASGTGDLTFGFNNVNDHALLTVTNGAADLTGQNISVNVTGVTGLSTGQQALIISGASALIGGPGGTAVDVTDNSVLWNFRMVDGTGVGAPTSANDLFLIAGQAAPINNLTSTTNNEHAADVLMTLQSTTNPELALIVGNMNGASTTEAFNEILESTQSVVDNSERSVQTGFINYLQDMAGNRLDEIRSLSMPETSARFGMREDEQTAQVLPGLQVWGYGFGAAPEQGSDHGLNDLAGRQWLAGSAGYTKQSSRQGIDGFDAVSGGAVFGIDTGKTFSDRVFGLAFGYGHAEVDSKNANRAENEIDSLQLLAYASKTFQDNYYGELKASYAQSSNDTTRYNVGGVPGLTANGDFTSKQAGLQASVGKHILHNDYLITPEFGVNWLHYTSEGYTETGAGGANLTVDTKDADSIEIGGSVRIVKEIKRDSGAIILPEVRAGYYYDLSKDPIQKTVSFAGGGGSFLIETPNPSQHRINLGTGVTVKGTGNWNYSLNYDLNLEQQFQDHSLVARASWKF